MAATDYTLKTFFNDTYLVLKDKINKDNVSLDRRKLTETEIEEVIRTWAKKNPMGFGILISKIVEDFRNNVIY